MADESPKKPCERGDELCVGPSVGGDAHLFVRHTADHRHVPGIMRPVREGEPLTSDVLHVTPKDPKNGVYHVEEIQVPSTPSMSSGRPAKVTSDAFRTGWDGIFGKQSVGQA